jgi:hypothetical protein
VSILESWRALRRSDAGAASVEKVGTVALAAVVVCAVILTASGVAEGGLASRAVCAVRQAAGFGGCAPGSAPKTDADYEPASCKVREESQTGGYEVSIGWFSIGEEYGFIEQTFSDGTVRMTLVDKASLSGKYGAGFDVGKVSSDGSKKAADIELAAGLKFGYGTTWQFKNADEAEHFRGEVEKYQVQMMQMQGEGAAGIAIYNSLTGNWADPPDPAITFASVGFEASIKGALGLKVETGGVGSDGKPRAADPNLGADLTIKGDYQVVIENNEKDGTRSYTYQVSGTAKGGANGVVASTSLGGTATGAMKVTRNDKGELASLTFISTREGSASFTAGGKTPVDVKGVGGKGGSSDQVGSATVTTTTVTFDTPAEQVVGQQWLSGSNEQFGSPLNMTWGSLVPSTPPADGNPWEQFLYENATVAQTSYQNIKDVDEFGAKISLGLKFGLSVKMETSESTVQDATFLGAPRANGERPMVPFSSCQ